MKKLNLFFTILLMLGIGFCPPLKAQTQIVKTLDDPGRAPRVEATLIDDPYSASFNFYIGPNITPYYTMTFDPFRSLLEDYVKGYSLQVTDTQTNTQFEIESSTILETPYSRYSFVFTWDPYELELSLASTPGQLQRVVFGSTARIDCAITPGGGPIAFGTDGTPITFTAEELAILNDANGRSFVMRQTATNATSVVNIPAQADAAAIGQAIKTAGVPHTIYIQPEVKNDGSLKIYADEAFTLEGDEILSISQHNVFEQKVAVYPNPTTEVLYLDHKESAEITYVVYDMTGKQMQTTHSKGAQHQINVELLAPGVYLLEATTGKQKKQWRFVKE